MRLLVCTQTVDKRDPVLGFFVRWIEEFAKHCTSVTVVCLREGEHALPSHVKVIALRSRTRLGRALELLRYIVVFRKDYSAVFVHMNPEYLVVAGWLWKLMNKKTALWYTHKSVDVKLRIAALFAGRILSASQESFRLRSKKLRVMGHGIDTEFFSPDTGTARGAHLLSVGRLMPSKRHDLAIESAARAGKELYIAGEGPERGHLETLARAAGVHVRFLGGLTQEQLRDEYRTAAELIHRSETGSLDKVVLEALACGLSVDTTDPHLSGLPEAAAGPAYVREQHSLSALIPAVLKHLS